MTKQVCTNMKENIDDQFEILRTKKCANKRERKKTKEDIDILI